MKQWFREILTENKTGIENSIRLTPLIAPGSIEDVAYGNVVIEIGTFTTEY